MFVNIYGKYGYANLRVLRAHVPANLACLGPHVPTCLACLRAHVQRCLACLCSLRALVPTCLSVPTFSCAITPNIKNKFSMTCITSNIKNKFSVTCFLEMFGTFSLYFTCEIKLHLKSERREGMSLERFFWRIQLHILAYFTSGGRL